MTSIFIGIPSYADPDISETLASAIRMSSARHPLRISVCEQVTRYAHAFDLGASLPDHVQLHVTLVGEKLIGIGGARNFAEQNYNGESIQLQVDSHARFEADWDVKVVRQVERLGDLAIVSSGQSSDPWESIDKIPVVQFDRYQDGLPAGYVQMVESVTGDLMETHKARTVIGHSIMGMAWCDAVPADPHIVFGEEPGLAARLWTHGRTLLHGRVPWVCGRPGTYRPSGRPWTRPEWTEKYNTSKRRTQVMLTGRCTKEDEAAMTDLQIYGLGHKRTLSDWLDYSGLDFVTQTVRSPWP